jgi:hypothetical protein
MLSTIMALASLLPWESLNSTSHFGFNYLGGVDVDDIDKVLVADVDNGGDVDEVDIDDVKDVCGVDMIYIDDIDDVDNVDDVKDIEEMYEMQCCTQCR